MDPKMIDEMITYLIKEYASNKMTEQMKRDPSAYIDHSDGSASELLGDINCVYQNLQEHRHLLELGRGG